MKIQLKSEYAKHFKGLREITIDFSPRTVISGANATGKTSIFDAYKWVTTDKDSHGSANFAIREHDENGKTIDNTDIVVRLTFDVDGETVTFEKTQRQKWTKRRGSATSELTGNENLFSINNFPCSKKDFIDRLNSLVDERILPIITGPRAFALLPWKQQREILMRLVDDVTDEWLMSLNDAFSLIADDVLEAGADKARDKYQKELKKLKADLDTYPIRIDEATHSLMDVEPADVMAKREADVKAELQAIKEERSKLAESTKDRQQIFDSLIEANKQIAQYAFNVQKELEDHKKFLEYQLHETEIDKRSAESGRERTQRSLDSANKAIADDQARIDDLVEKYKNVKLTTMPKDATVCPTCKREFEPDDIEKIRVDFEGNKAKQLDRITVEGRAIREDITLLTGSVIKCEEELNKFADEITECDERISKLNAELKALPERVDFDDDDVYLAMQNSIADLEDKLTGMPKYDDYQKELESREAKVTERMMEVAQAKVDIENNARIRERIQELQAAQKECGQKVAEWEQKMYLVEKFIEQKMTLISDRINSKFKAVRFKLFDTLINGSVVPTCVMQINSNGSYVDYPSANNAAQIIGGLDVIETLSKLYGVSAPIFIDNSESINTFNIPEMDSQLILMEVTDDEELVVTHL